MKTSETLQEYIPQIMELPKAPERKIGKRTIEFLDDPEGEARRIWNSLRAIESIPLNKLQSQTEFSDYMGEKHEGLRYLSDNMGLYEFVLDFEVSNAKEEKKEFRKKRTEYFNKKEIFIERIKKLPYKNIKTEVPTEWKVKKYKVKGKFRTYIIDKKTNRIISHFKYKQK